LNPAEYHLLDCAIRDRIGRFIPPRHDVWYEYGDDKVRLAEILTDNAELCLKVFSQYSVLWSDPAIWLTDVADDLILSPQKKGPWCATLALEFFRGCLEVRLKMTKRARPEFQTYIDNARDETWRAAMRRWVNECCASLEFDPRI